MVVAKHACIGAFHPFRHSDASLRFLVQDAICRIDGTRTGQRHRAHSVYLLQQLFKHNVSDLASCHLVSPITRTMEHVPIHWMEQRQLETPRTDNSLCGSEFHSSIIRFGSDLLLAYFP